MTRLARMLGAALALALMANMACAQALKEVRQLEGITEYALPNGFSLLLAPDASTPTTTVNLTYRVGSAHEGHGETGAAHLLEHMLFRSTATIADPKAELNLRGVRWNGTTAQDRTNYLAFFRNNPETLDWTLAWLAEAMTRANIRKGEFSSELTVVRNEMERAENDATGVLGSRMLATAYDWHGYGHRPLGARSDVEHIPIERLRSFYERNYRPDNAVLVIGGTFDAAAVRAQVEKTFGPIPRPMERMPAPYTVEPAQDGERSVVLRRVGGSAKVAVLYHVMPATSRAFAPLAVLAQSIGMDGGPLSEALIRRGVGTAQASFVPFLGEPGYLTAGLTLAEGTSEAEALRAGQALARTMESLRLTESQVEQARSRALKSLNDITRNPESLSPALSEAIARGDWRLWFAMRDWIASVTLPEVQRVADTWLLPSNRTLGTYLPAHELPPRAPLMAPVDVASELADYKGGTASAAPADDFPSTVSNIEAHAVYRQLTVGGEPGLKLVMLPRPTKGDRVTGTLRLRWGSAESLNGQVAVAEMAGRMLMMGTQARSADDISKSLLALDATLRIGANAGALTANFEVPARHLASFDALLSEILRRPRFGDAAFQQVQALSLAGLASSGSDPAVVASLALHQVFSAPATDQAGRDAGRYPPGDPRTLRTLDEQIAQMRALTPAQLHLFWARFGGARDGELALVGPVQPNEVTAQWQKELGEWASQEPRHGWSAEWPTDLDRMPPSPPLWIPDKANASYVARIPLAMNSESPDYPALFAGIRILRGSLAKRVREDEGLSYSIEASLSAPSASKELTGGHAASINLAASFAPQNRTRLQAIVRDELTQRATAGYSDREVIVSTRAILSARVDDLAQPATLAATLANLLRHGHGMQRHAAFDEAYRKLDANAVNAALRKYLRPDRMVEIMAGTFP
ncbi:M16 family metallopeptidase [Variovorax rhizosphaerae]|uniref:Insulinase family protein n=1 Tax=Variovorax rhizosphaerae TaxID=1836200 RepID=A0ABU8WJ57_9BURK